MSDKQTEFKDSLTTYHAQMRHQSKYRLELDVADSPRPVTNKASSSKIKQSSNTTQR